MSLREKLEAIKPAKTMHDLVKENVELLHEFKQKGKSYKDIHHVFCEEFNVRPALSTFAEYFRQACREEGLELSND
ncbi:hypothetical protein [Endozoicomonas ascidiicola]|uniref:hypothetical protein n=1 Tax=Endozoicomonas ascidiicola TaxID=1698521 RepID=UPI000834655F|nr:hypothetical protein [Endozoicomonas ascidiicola]